jgi:flagellum-specific peptidoglycan hydrolase FlgJ
MQRKVRKLKRKGKKTLDKFVDTVALSFKIGVVLLILFFVMLFFIIEPIDFIGKNFSSSNEAVEITENMSKTEFIETLTPHAKKAQEEYGTRPSLLIAQAALESNWGQSTLSTASNNYFGIKNSQNGKQYATSEYNNEEWTQVNASFQQYDSLAESIEDYASLLKNGTSWDSNFYQDVIEAENYQAAAVAVQEAGYATDPDYANKLIRIIEQHQLYELDV